MIPLFGWFLKRAGMIAIDRSGKAAALKQMVADARDVFAQGAYPGLRSHQAHCEQLPEFRATRAKWFAAEMPK